MATHTRSHSLTARKMDRDSIKANPEIKPTRADGKWTSKMANSLRPNTRTRSASTASSPKDKDTVYSCTKIFTETSLESRKG